MKRLLKSIFSLKGLVAVLFVLFFVVPMMQSWRIEKLRRRRDQCLGEKARQPSDRADSPSGKRQCARGSVGPLH